MLTARKTFSLFTFFVLFASLLAACNLPSGSTPTEEPNLIHTLAAQTVAAQLTQQASSGGQIATLPPTQAVATATQAAPTATVALPTATIFVPTTTSVPPTATPIPCNLMEFVKDVNYPDDTEVEPGETIVKTWRLKNIGSCTWTSSYSVVFDHGSSMDGPASVQLTNGQVPPGDSVDVSVTLKAPNAEGTYQGYWMLRDSYQNVFGIGPSNKAFWIKVKVINPANYDFVAQADNAVWRNASAELPFGDRSDDNPGIVDVYDNFKLEDNKEYDNVLVTYPQRITDGVINGLYGKYVVKADDHFRADIGFAANCSGGKVEFQLYYRQGETLTLLKEWEKTCNGSLSSVSVDLEALEGKEVNFVLAVNANGAWENDKAVWVNPRIQD